MQEQIRDTHRRKVNAQMVPGWGIDADPKNDPTFPMKKHVEGEHEPYTGHRPTRPEQQQSNVEVLHSNERPNLTAVYGTKLPPSGLSGMIRRAAFNFSESSYGHWLPLMLADRVEMVEGVVDDLAHGHIPNVFSEAGWKADWKYNRKAVVTKVAVGTAVAVGIYALIRSMRSDGKSSSDNRDRTSSGSTGTAASGALAKPRQLESIRSAQHDVMKERMAATAAQSSAEKGKAGTMSAGASETSGTSADPGKSASSGTKASGSTKQGSSNPSPNKSSSSSISDNA